MISWWHWAWDHISKLDCTSFGAGGRANIAGVFGVLPDIWLQLQVWWRRGLVGRVWTEVGREVGGGREAA